MTYHKRRVLFLFAVLLFTVAAGPLVFYTFGYRFSWTDFAINATGGIFVVTEPKNASVKIDDKESLTSLFSGNLFVQNLKPGMYSLEITKDGYSTWAKTLRVAAHNVAEAHVTLVPQKPTETVLAQRPFFDFIASPNARVFFLRERTDTNKFFLTFFVSEERVFLAPADASTQKILDAAQNLPANINWSNNERSAIAELGNDWVQIFIQDNNTVRITSRYRESKLLKELPKKPRSIIAHPYTDDQFYILEAENLYLWNTSTGNLRPLLGTVAGVQVQQNRLLILDSLSGFLYETGLDARSPRQLTLAGIPGTKRAEIKQSGSMYFLESDKGYWVFDAEEEYLQILSNTNTTSFDITSNNTIWWNEHEIWIRWTVLEKELPFFQTVFEEKVFGTKQNIKYVAYYSGRDYLIIQVEKAIYVMELDGRGGIRNTVKFYEGENPQILVPRQDRAVYILDRSTLFELALER